ncbi:hypothetical protein [Streptomyces sp. NPDC049906]|uniref:hypothetical protein n=1 Tax=Streptomyces sp. NPDC049906 TaxID=3155656 RepID=UPI00344A02C1
MAARRRTITALAVAGATLVAPLAVGCGAIDKALDCVRTAEAIAESVNDLQQAVENAANDPLQAEESLRAIDKNLDEIGDTTDNADLSKAVDDLAKAVDNVGTAIEGGDQTPDVTPVADAAGELTKVCSP